MRIKSDGLENPDLIGVNVIPRGALRFQWLKGLPKSAVAIECSSWDAPLDRPYSRIVDFHCSTGRLLNRYRSVNSGRILFKKHL